MPEAGDSAAHIGVTADSASEPPFVQVQANPQYVAPASSGTGAPYPCLADLQAQGHHVAFGQALFFADHIL
jgi:hypothetical protein